MSFIAIKDGERVIPEEVDDKVDVSCPDCGGRMRPRGPTSDGRARHFFLVENLGGNGGGSSHSCSGGGGEDDIHRKYKSFVVSRLKELYSDFAEFCKPEQRLSGIIGDNFEGYPSGKEYRQADAMMLLEQPTSTFGRGLIVEVQYRNLGKDIEETERDYLRNGFSVLWVGEDDFESDRCLLTKKQIRQNVISVWPNAVPDSTEWRNDQFEGLDMVDFRLLSSRWYRANPSDVFQESLDNFWRANVAMFPEDGHKFKAPPIEAKLPNEFIDEIAEDVKRMYDWGDLFEPPEDYSPLWGYSKVPATLPPEWHAEKAHDFWRQEPWRARFRPPPTPLWKFTNDASVEAEIPLAKFILDEKELGYNRAMLRRSHSRGRPDSNESIWVECRECGAGRSVTVVGGLPDGMTSYSKTLECRECGEKTWHAV